MEYYVVIRSKVLDLYIVIWIGFNNSVLSEKKVCDI